MSALSPTSVVAPAGLSAASAPPAGARTPLLDEVLGARFEALSAAQVAALCARTSLGEALSATVATLHGVSPRVFWQDRHAGVGQAAWGLDGVPDRVGGRTEGTRGRVGQITIVEPARQLGGWGSPDGPEQARTRERRRDILVEHLSRAMVTGRTLDTVVRLGMRAGDEWWMDLRIGFTLWWDTRIAEGHTPDSARTLLGLIAEPAVLAQFSFEDAAGPRLRTARPWRLHS